MYRKGDRRSRFLRAVVVAVVAAAVAAAAVVIICGLRVDLKVEDDTRIAKELEKSSHLSLIGVDRNAISFSDFDEIMTRDVGRKIEIRAVKFEDFFLKKTPTTRNRFLGNGLRWNEIDKKSCKLFDRIMMFIVVIDKLEKRTERSITREKVLVNVFFDTLNCLIGHRRIRNMGANKNNLRTLLTRYQINTTEPILNFEIEIRSWSENTKEDKIDSFV